MLLFNKNAEMCWSGVWDDRKYTVHEIENIMLDEIVKFNKYDRPEFVVSEFVVSGNATENGTSYASVRLSSERELIIDENKTIYSSKHSQTNKVVNVTLTGGIIGFLGDSPQNSLNREIRKENANGWRVVQIIPAASGNIFLIILRLLILFLTLFFYTPTNGYYVIMERKAE